jgi:CheY-like chemotaxis protein
MPVCDGFEAISLIRVLETMQVKITPRNATPLTPAVIVALTGLAAQRDRDAAMAAGADHFVTKPLKFSALRELLVEWGVRADGMSRG